MRRSNPFSERSYGFKKSLGFGLVEILLVIGVIAVLSYVVFDAYRGVKSKQEAATEQRTIAVVLGGSKRLAKGNYQGLNNQVLNEEGTIPYSLNGGDTTTANLINQWGGRVDIQPTDGTIERCSPTAQRCVGLRIDYQGVPEDVCLALVPVLRTTFAHIHTKPDDGDAWLVLMQPRPAIDYSVEKMIEGCRAGGRISLRLAT